jgi:hypothetical protein
VSPVHCAELSILGRYLLDRSEASAELSRLPGAERATDREELTRVVNMMGDTNVETVRRHFNFQYEEDDEQIDG